MSLDFAKIKEVKLVDVMGRYGVPLRFKGEYAAAQCPLPTHKDGDISKSFSINLAGNYFRCFSESCNEKNGGKKGGDVINFVALKEGISQLEAARKLADWYHIGETKTAPHMAKPSNETEMQRTISEPKVSSESVKYMKEVEAWFYALIVRGDKEADVEFWSRVLKGVKTRLHDSYKAGQRSRAA